MRKKFVAAVLVLGCALALATPSRAEFVVNGSAGSAFVASPAPGDYANANRPYWDNLSTDKSNNGPAFSRDANIGFFLTKTGVFGEIPYPTSIPPYPADADLPIAQADLEYFASTDTRGRDENITFGKAGDPKKVPITLEIEVAGLAAANKLYIHNADGTYTLVFKGSDGAVQTKSIDVDSPFSLVLFSGQRWFFDSNGTAAAGLSADDPALLDFDPIDAQQFAVFRDKNKTDILWVGAEDVNNAIPRGAGGVARVEDFDYQDMVIKMTREEKPDEVVPVPPSAVLGVIGGLSLGLGRLIRRRRGTQL